MVGKGRVGKRRECKRREEGKREGSVREETTGEGERAERVITSAMELCSLMISFAVS